MVIPKALRDAAGLATGGEVDIELRDGRIEIEVVSAPMRLAKHGRALVVAAGEPMPQLSAEDVRDVLERARR